MSQKNICFLTSTRADYGLIKPLMDKVRGCDELSLQLIAFGTHLSEKHGNTVQQIKADGFTVDAAFDTAPADDSAPAIAAAMGQVTGSVAKELNQLNPDLVMLVGDRYEMLSAASAALVMGVPMAHLYGGDVTEGAYDDAIRHSLTKMSVLHFCSNEVSRRRIIQMGEQPESVYCTGSPSLDVIPNMPKLTREELSQRFGFAWHKRMMLVTFHPVTRGEASSSGQVEALLHALNGLGDEWGIIITAPNADNEGDAIRAQFEHYVAQKDNAYFVTSFGHVPYLNMLAACDMVVGNSSSGLYEAPSFHVPTVNIGTRQEGRLKAASVVDCGVSEQEIAAAMNAAMELDCRDAVNPYGDGTASEQIVKVLCALPDNPKTLLKKSFYENE